MCRKKTMENPGSNSIPSPTPYPIDEMRWEDTPTANLVTTLIEQLSLPWPSTNLTSSTSYLNTPMANLTRLHSTNFSPRTFPRSPPFHPPIRPPAKLKTLTLDPWRPPTLLHASSSSSSPSSSTRTSNHSTETHDNRIRRVHSAAELDSALASSNDRLVVVEYAASHSRNSRRIYPVMVELSQTCPHVDFLLVMGDESDATRDLCRREGVDRVPHFTFYRSAKKVHEEIGISPDELRGDVLYYGDSHSRVVQLRSRFDVDSLVEKEKGEGGRLVVLDVGLKRCGPCVKVYPTVMKLSRTMEDVAVFARIDGDENQSCMGFLKDMEVVEVPTFLFIKDGEMQGRYVGSGKSELVGEILRYQGVNVT